jgi:predicted metal-dependent phosphoesterase TrpH
MYRMGGGCTGTTDAGTSRTLKNDPVGEKWRTRGGSMQQRDVVRSNGRRGRADIHIHTTASDGLGTPQEVVRVVEQHGLDLIAIADHDTISGAFAARDLAARENRAFEVIVGTEVTTARGVHLLALFVEDPIPSFRPLEDTIELVARQGGLCIAPHSLSPLTPSVGRRQIERLLRLGIALAGVETLNPTPAGRIRRDRLRLLNRHWQLAETGGSDAHFLQSIGTAYTEYDGRSAADFRASLLAHTTTAVELPRPHPPISLGDYARQSGRSLVIHPLEKVRRGLSHRT